MSTYIQIKCIYVFLLICITSLAFVIRFEQLSIDELWLDEAFTGFVSLNNEWFDYIIRDNNPPFYYLIQRLNCYYFNCDELGLRVPSLFFGVVFIIILINFLNQYTDKSSAVIISFLVTISPIHIFYSQEARSYSLLLTLLLIFLSYQYKIVHKKNNSPFVLVLFFCISLITLFTHYFASILIVCCIIVYILESVFGFRQIPKAYFLAILIAAVPFTLWLSASFFYQTTEFRDLTWVNDRFFSTPIWKFFDGSISTFLTGTGDFPLSLKRYTKIQQSILTTQIDYAAFALYILILTLTFFNIRKLNYDEKLMLFELTCFTLMPLILLLSLSLIYNPVYVVGRYDLIAYPSFILLLGFIVSKYSYKLSCISKKIRISVIFIFFVLVTVSQIIKVNAYKNALPISGLKEQIKNISSLMGKNDLFVINRPDAAVPMYYLEYHGFKWRNNYCNNRESGFFCTLFPKNMELSPAASSRYKQTNEIPSNELDVSYILEFMSDDSSIFLYAKELTIIGNEKINISSATLKLLEKLTDQGLVITNLSPELDIIQLQKI